MKEVLLELPAVMFKKIGGRSITDKTLKKQIIGLYIITAIVLGAHNYFAHIPYFTYYASGTYLGGFIFLLLKSEDAEPFVTTMLYSAIGWFTGFVSPSIWGGEIMHGIVPILMLMTVVPFILTLEKLIVEIFLRLFVLIGGFTGLVFFAVIGCYTIGGGSSSIKDAITVITIGLVFSKAISEVLKELEDRMTEAEHAQAEHALAGLNMALAIGTIIFGIALSTAEPYGPVAQIAARLGILEFFAMSKEMLYIGYFSGFITLLACHYIPVFRRWFGYGTEMPPVAWEAIREKVQADEWNADKVWTLGVQAASLGMFMYLLLSNYMNLLQGDDVQYVIHLSALTGMALNLGLNGFDYEEHGHHAPESKKDETKEKHEFISGKFGHVMTFVMLVMGPLFTQVSQLKQHSTFSEPIKWAMNKYGPIEGAELTTNDIQKQATVFAAATAGETAVSENMFTVVLMIGELDKAMRNGVITVPPSMFNTEHERLIMRNRIYRFFVFAILIGATYPSIWLYIGCAALLFLAMNSYAASIGLKPKRIFRACLPFAFVLTIVSMYYIRYEMFDYVMEIHDNGTVQDLELTDEYLDSRLLGGHESHGSKDHEEKSDEHKEH